MANKKLIFGKYVLDSLSVGMYNHPFTLFREYIQNSTDAIDCMQGDNGKTNSTGKIEIEIDGASKSIIIKDTGCGIRAKDAYSVLHNIGASTKLRTVSRGFRGIGRLGGLGYCDELRFITKAKGEKICSISTWDSLKLRSIISGINRTQDARSIVHEITSFTQTAYRGHVNDHFFTVEIRNVKSSKDLLLNVPQVKNYLRQVAPISFAKSRFRYADEINEMLANYVPAYKTYSVSLNGEQMFKLYQDEVTINKGVSDRIDGIDCIQLIHEGKLIATGWIAKLKLCGAVSPVQGVEGIRLRSGNLLVGDKNILSNYFKESRFSNYLVGELHIVTDKLVLNGRRDDFEDNQSKEQFYSAFLKEIGLPYSKKIREISSLRSEQKSGYKIQRLKDIAKRIVTNGHVSEAQRFKVASEISSLLENEVVDVDMELKELLADVESSQHLFSINYQQIPSGVKALLKDILDIVYKTSIDKNEAERIIGAIIKKVENTYWKNSNRCVQNSK